MPLYLKFSFSHSIPFYVKYFNPLFTSMYATVMYETPERHKNIHLKVEIKTHLVLVEGIRDVIGHVAGWMGQNDDHVCAGGARWPQPVRLGLDKRGQPESAELVFCLAQAWSHLT